MKQKTQLELRIEKMFDNELFKQFVLKCIKPFKFNQNLQNNIDFLVDTVMMNPNIFLKPPFMLAKMKITSKDLDFTNCIKKYNLEENKMVIINSISKYGSNLKYASVKLKKKKEIVEIALNNDGLAIEYASKKLRNDIILGKKAIINNPDSYYYLSEELKNNREIIKTLLIKDPSRSHSFDYVEKYDELIKEVIIDNGLALKYANRKLRNSKSLVLKACKNNIKALMYASSEILNNQEYLIVLSKKLKSDQVIYYADTKLRTDKEFLKRLIKETNFKLYFIEDYLKDQLDLVETAIETDIRNLEHASKRIRSNEVIILNLIKKYGNILNYVDNSLLEDNDFMYKAIKEYNGCIKNIPKSSLENQEFKEKIASINIWCRNYIKNVEK